MTIRRTMQEENMTQRKKNNTQNEAKSDIEKMRFGSPIQYLDKD